MQLCYFRLQTLFHIVYPWSSFVSLAATLGFPLAFPSVHCLPRSQPFLSICVFFLLRFFAAATFARASPVNPFPLSTSSQIPPNFPQSIGATRLQYVSKAPPLDLTVCNSQFLGKISTKTHSSVVLSQADRFTPAPRILSPPAKALRVNFYPKKLTSTTTISPQPEPIPPLRAPICSRPSS